MRAGPLGRLTEVHALARAVRETTGTEPTLDYALASIERVLGLPAGAAFTLFAVGRVVGWIAHAMEQSADGRLIRPRARYIGEYEAYRQPACLTDKLSDSLQPTRHPGSRRTTAAAPFAAAGPRVRAAAREGKRQPRPALPRAHPRPLAAVQLERLAGRQPVIAQIALHGQPDLTRHHLQNRAPA